MRVELYAMGILIGSYPVASDREVTELVRKSPIVVTSYLVILSGPELARIG